jgi:glucokinase
MNILCGDIGGTKTRLAVYAVDAFPEPIAENSYLSRNFGSLTEVAHPFLSDLDLPIAYAVFGLAGPILERNCKATNLPWQIDADKMEQELQIPSVHLINDLEATAYGIAALKEGDLLTLQQGSASPSGNRAVIAAGTGLGQAGVFWDGAQHVPFATEGGHCDFAPSNKLEFELLSALKQSSNNVCWEDILSGPGLVSIYCFLSGRHNQPKPEWFSNNQSAGDAAETITNLANDQLDPIAVEALELFSRLYGAEAGNLALKQMATGGLYIGGGIAPKIVRWLQQPQFLEAFCQKGKMHSLMQSIPIRVILNDRAALYGPAIYLLNHVLEKKKG